MNKAFYLLLVAQCLVLTFGGYSMLPGSCPGAKYDIGFLLDASHMSRSQFRREVAIMKGIVRAFHIGLGSNRAGLVTFGKKVTTLIRRHPEDPASTSIHDFMIRVSNLKNSGNAYIDRGLDEAADTLFNPGDDLPGYTKILFVLTDGRQRTQRGRQVDLKYHTRNLLRFRVKIIAIAMGPRPQWRYIKQLVTDPKRDIMWSRSSRTQIRGTVQEAINAVCLKRPSPPGPTCKSKVDLAFLLDASGSIGTKNWPKEPEFVMNVLRKLGDFQQKDGIRAGVIIYSSESDVNLWIKLNDFKSLGEFEKKLNSFKYPKYKATAISKALLKARTELFQSRNGDRADAQNVLILVTDGKQNPKLKDGDTLNNYAQPLREAGVTTVAVGVGSAKVNELKMIAGDPSRYFTLGSIRELGKAVEFVSSKVCDSCEVNIAFVLDSSQTTAPYYKHEKKLVQFVSTRLQAGSSKTKVAVISFSTSAKLEIGFDEYQDSLESFNLEVSFLRNVGGRTNVKQGLLYAEKEFKNPRSTTLNGTLPKVIVLVSDGLENEEKATGTAERLRSEGFHIVAVSLGAPDMALLSAITGSQKLIYDVDYRSEYVHFNKMVGKIVHGVCKKK